MKVAQLKVRRLLAPLALLSASLLAGGCGLELGNQIELAGEWELRRGFDPAWLASPVENKTVTELPRRFAPKDGILTGQLTLRRRITAAQLATLPRDQILAVNPGWMADVYRLYWNEHPIGGMGSVAPYVPGSQRHSILEIPRDAVNREGSNILTVVLFSNGSFDLEVLEPIRIGSTSTIYQRHFTREILSFVLIGIYLIVGLYHLLLFSKRTQDRHNLFFGLFCVEASIYWFFRIPSRDWLFGEQVLWRHRAEIMAVFSLGPTLLFFLSYLFSRKSSRIAVVLAALCAGLAVAVFFGNRVLVDQCLTVWQIIALPMMAYIIVYVSLAALRGNRDARYIGAGVLLLMLTAIHDVLSGLGFTNNPHLARYSFVVFVVGIAGLLANRFVRVHNSVAELNEQLEQKVLDRTQRLQETLTQVQHLKEQQDGDYFLTSLLLVPLGSVSVRSSTVSVRVLIRQKKRFQFRKWTAEIGGDICVAETIVLRGRRFVALINGDAMGKSIQGAGGAIVLGSVFKSLISRTKLSSAAQARYPEQWLKECFVELQNVFVPFSGSMLISAVIGLVDEVTGAFYFINAEHPGVVLYRGGTARFLDDSRQLRKIGIEGIDGGLFVNVFGLVQEDVLILGSDGRDDLLLGVDEAGHRIINENERLFVTVTAEARGDLSAIERGLSQSGSFTDDLSLMRIGFREDAAFGDLPQPAGGLEEARALAESGDNASAAAAFVAYCERAPLDSDALLEAARVMRAAGQLVDAADFGERYRLRNPESIENLIELADTYRRAGNFGRALMLIERARAVAAESADRGVAVDLNVGERIRERVAAQDSAE